ncbi:MAG TPA: 3-hydroxyacyl-CoA dehydrogenase family protein [Spirochaetia bacterium]
MSIAAIGVVGAGTMGTGIAHVAAAAGLEVVLRDIDAKYLTASLVRMEASMDKAVAKEKMTAAQKKEALARIRTTTDLGDLRGVDVVIEAVLEDLELKKGVFRELGALCESATIFATNTSSMSVTEIAAASGRPERFCGIHFFNPVTVMKLVEIVCGLSTAESTVEIARELTDRMGKTAVLVRKDSPGFIVNRLLLPFMNEAARLLSEGVASAQDIDTAIKLGLNHPMGPFELLDMGGSDLTVTILDYLRAELGDEHYAPQHILRQMTRANKCGRKSGEGFYKYP